MRPRETVLIEVPEDLEALLERDTAGAWPRAPRLARVVNNVYEQRTLRQRLEDLARELVSRQDDVLHARRHRRVVSLHLTPRLAAQLRGLERARTQLESGTWEHPAVAWAEREPQERAFLCLRPLGSLWKDVGRKKQVKIRPKQRRTLPVSVRFPLQLYDEVTAYAEHLGADRTYVIVECVRQTLEADRAWKREWKQRGSSQLS